MITKWIQAIKNWLKSITNHKSGVIRRGMEWPD